MNAYYHVRYWLIVAINRMRWLVRPRLRGYITTKEMIAACEIDPYMREEIAKARIEVRKAFPKQEDSAGEAQ